MRVKNVILLFSILSFYCASPQVKEEPKTEVVEPDKTPEPAEPVDPLAKYRNLESENLKVHTSGGVKQIQVLSSSAPMTVVDSNEKLTVEIPIGSANNIICSVIDKDTPAGKYLTQADKELGSISGGSYKFYQYGVRIIKRVPVIDVVYDYYNPSKEFGNYKISILKKNGFESILCSHDEPGYVKTFQKVVESFASSDYITRFYTRSGKYLRYEIFTTNLNSKPIGFLEAYIFREGSDMFLSVNESVTLIARSDKDFIVSDDNMVSYTSSINGELMLQKAETHENGKQTLQITMQRLDTGKYRLTGTKQRKEIQATITSPGPVITSDWAVHKLKEQMSKNPSSRSVVFYEFIPSLPSQFSRSEVTYLKTEGAGNTYKYTSSFGITMKLMDDEKGFWKIVVDLGIIQLEMKRVIVDKT